jgi:septum formation protein
MSTPTRPRLILASQSPRRRELLAEAGYDYVVQPPSPSAECGVCSGESPAALVARLAEQKARDVAQHVAEGIVVGCDTVAECQGQVLGKPADEEHARAMLRLLRGRKHRVLSGLCLIERPSNKTRTQIAVTTLEMLPLDDAEIEDYLASGQWQGKAGAFGLQDRLGWIRVIEGSESNVVGLPLELLAEMLDAPLGERGAQAP